jgi:hypothetical protein
MAPLRRLNALVRVPLVLEWHIAAACTLALLLCLVLPAVKPP